MIWRKKLLGFVSAVGTVTGLPLAGVGWLMRLILDGSHSQARFFAGKLSGA